MGESIAKGPIANGEQTESQATKQWISRVVRPAFQQFAILCGVNGFGPVVSSTETGCEIEIESLEDPREKFDACVGVAAPDSVEIDARIPEFPRAFGDRRRDGLDSGLIQEVLDRSFQTWLAGARPRNRTMRSDLPQT